MDTLDNENILAGDKIFVFNLALKGNRKYWLFLFLCLVILILVSYFTYLNFLPFRFEYPLISVIVFVFHFLGLLKKAKKFDTVSFYEIKDEERLNLYLLVF